MIQNPVLVDLDVSEIKDRGSATGGIGTSIGNIQDEAVKDAIEKSGADVLVQPKFEMETSDGLTTVTVIGYPANYKNFRPMKPEDAPLLQVGGVQKLSFYEPSKEEQKKGTGAIIGISCLFSLIGLLLILSL